jgi:hypothetical protein
VLELNLEDTRAVHEREHASGIHRLVMGVEDVRCAVEEVDVWRHEWQEQLQSMLRSQIARSELDDALGSHVEWIRKELELQWRRTSDRTDAIVEEQEAAMHKISRVLTETSRLGGAVGALEQGVAKLMTVVSSCTELETKVVGLESTHYRLRSGTQRVRKGVRKGYLISYALKRRWAQQQAFVVSSDIEAIRGSCSRDVIEGLISKVCTN